MDYLLSKHGTKKDIIVLWGEGLGSAVAIEIAARYQSKIHAVIATNAFTSMPALVEHRLPWGLKWLHRFVNQYWNSEIRLTEMLDAAMTTGRFPHFLFLAGQRDAIVPSKQTALLASLAEKAQEVITHSHVEYVAFPHGTHHSLAEQPGFYETVFKFLTKVSPQPK